MLNATRYKETVCWRTLCLDVYLLTEDNGENPATFRLSVKVIDGNDSGALSAILTGYYLVDNIGAVYRIIAVGSGTIDVSDDFMTYQCPTVGMDGFICKSVWNGRAPYLTTEQLQFLHPLALSNINKYNLDILWSNDPNSKRIGFTAVSQPSITDYSVDVTCMDGTVINPRRDYEEDPKFEVWQETEEGKHSRLAIDPQITRADGLITSVLFSGTGELINGYILISK